MRHLKNEEIDNMQHAFDYAGIGKITSIHLSDKVCLTKEVEEYANKKGVNLKGKECDCKPIKML